MSPQGLCPRRLHPAGMGCLGWRQALSGSSHGRWGVPETTAQSQRIGLGQIMAEGEHSGNAQATPAGLSQCDQGLGLVTAQIRNLGA
jgi:hypothetical protein